MRNVDVKDYRQLIAFGDDFFSKSAKANRKQQRKWLLNILFIIGDQLCSINEKTGGIDRIKVELDPDYTVRVINNRIMPIYRTMVAKLTKSKPIPMCTANSREDKDVQSARAATKLLTNHWLNLDLDEGHQEIAGWLVSCGNVFVKQFYNPNKGNSISLDNDIVASVKQLIQSDEVEMDPGGKTEELMRILDGTTSVPLGDTDLVIRNPFNCYPEPHKSKMSKMTIFGDSEFLSSEEIYEKHGIEIDGSSVSSTADKYIYNVGIGDIINTGEMDLETTNNSLIEVREIYILPNKTFKKGATYKWAGDKILGEVKECKEIPVTHFGFIRVPGKFWHEALITDLIPMQRRWNELLSKVEMHNDLYNDPPVVIDPNVIDIDEWVAKPGLILEKKLTGAGADAPWVMPVPTLDQAIFQEINILDKQFEIVPVLNKVSFGKDTPNARSGLAINYLQEKDDDVMRPLVVELENGFTKVFKRDFKLCQENYKEDRGFAIVGEDSKIEWTEFSKANLTANIDIKVEPGSAMPKSIAAQQAMILELMDRGFFVNPKTGQMDYGRISKYMEFGGIEDMYEDMALDADHAKRCIEKIREGEPVIVQPWFNANAHLYEVNRFRKTTSYDELAEDVKFLVDNYATQCMVLVQPTGAPESSDPNAKTPTSGPAPTPNTVTPSSGTVPAVTPPAGTASPVSNGVRQEDTPLNDEEIRALLSQLRSLNPKLWKQIKNLDPNQVAGMLDTIMSSEREINSNGIPQ